MNESVDGWRDSDNSDHFDSADYSLGKFSE